jgi:hypothetical protein
VSATRGKWVWHKFRDGAAYWSGHARSRFARPNICRLIIHLIRLLVSSTALVLTFKLPCDDGVSSGRSAVRDSEPVYKAGGGSTVQHRLVTMCAEAIKAGYGGHELVPPPL